MVDVRCLFCGRLLIRTDVLVGEIKCHSCKTINKIDVLTSKGIDRLTRSGIIKQEAKSPEILKSGFFNKMR